MNSVTIVGRLAFETKLMGEAGTVAKNTVAISYKTKDKKQHTDWIPVVAFGISAEILASKEKGSQVIISGSITSNQYEDKDGNKKTSIQVTAREVYSAVNARREDRQAPQETVTPSDDI